MKNNEEELNKKVRSAMQRVKAGRLGLSPFDDDTLSQMGKLLHITGVPAVSPRVVNALVNFSEATLKAKKHATAFNDDTEIVEGLLDDIADTARQLSILLSSHGIEVMGGLEAVLLSLGGVDGKEDVS